MRRLVLSLCLLLLWPLAACGQDPVDAYCSDLTTHRKQIAEMLDSGSPDALFSRRDLLRELEEKSPPDLRDEWQTFLGAVEGLRKALSGAGVKASDFTGGTPPAGLSASDQRAIVEAADRLSSDDVVTAASGIEQQARDVCKVNLGLA